MLYVLLDLLRARLLDWDLYRFVRVLDQLTFRALAAAAIAFFTVLVLGRPVIEWLRRRKIGDTGLTDAAGLRQAASSKANTPTMGGLLIVGAAAGSTLLLADVRGSFYINLGLVVMLWLAALGGFDDWLKLTAASRPGASRQGLRAWEKLVFQIGLGALVGVFLYSHGDSAAPRDLAHVLNLPFQRTYDPGAGGAISGGLWFLPRGLFVIWAILFLTGMSNATNITDGMDGLAAGVTVAVGAGLIVLCFIAGDEGAAQRLLVPFVTESDELIVLAAAVTGSCLGFLWWNCAPAQVFMGDTGSLALGGTLAYIALVIRQEFLLLLMSGVFLVEIASVVLQVGYFKWSGGKRVFRCAPYHHHLHLGGWTEQQVVARFWIISAILMVLGLALVKVR
ncbi:MAG TPA: phospho-N-acetylmuramoyl-pentapeptide-transferase [Phycisphaerales bacterium]|nr:phospho-N-acetylmuramoyl-pentapeptide-transferase [Phycisphaerales bacterium]